MTEAKPFEQHPRFKTVAEYARWFLRTYPDAPEWVNRLADDDRGAVQR